MEHNSKLPIKPLDFVSPVNDSTVIGMITEINSNTYSSGIKYSASITWIGNSKGLHNAWWLEDEIVVVDSLPRILATKLAHPFGGGKEYVDQAFPKT